MIAGALVGLVLLGLYAWGVHRLRRPWPAWRTAAAGAGAATLVVALGALDARADAHFRAHMLQHLLVGTVAPPLVALSAPVRLALGALPSGGRRALAAALHARAVRALAQPVVAVALFVVVVLGIHITPLLEAGADHEPVHVLEHAALFWTSLLAWMIVLGIDPLPHRLGPVGAVVALMAMMAPMAFIGSIYRDFPHLLAPHFAHEPNPMDAQRAGGMIMWIGDTIVMAPAVVALGIYAAWREEVRQRRREAAEALR